MPNEIPQKGESLALMSVAFFDYLKDDIKNHLISGLDDHYNRTQPHNIYDSIAVKKFKSPESIYKNGLYDYSFYTSRPEFCTLPLEVIFRFGINLLTTITPDRRFQ